MFHVQHLGQNRPSLELRQQASNGGSVDDRQAATRQRHRAPTVTELHEGGQRIAAMQGKGVEVGVAIIVDAVLGEGGIARSGESVVVGAVERPHRQVAVHVMIEGKGHRSSCPGLPLKILLVRP